MDRYQPALKRPKFRGYLHFPSLDIRAPGVQMGATQNMNNYGPPITLENAKKVVAMALAEARKNS
mgnify:CR=1 FL=1